MRTTYVNCDTSPSGCSSEIKSSQSPKGLKVTQTINQNKKALENSSLMLMFIVSQRWYNLNLENKIRKYYSDKKKSIWENIIVQYSKLTITGLALIIANGTDHPLNSHFTLLPSGHRDRTLKWRRAGFGRSLVPSAIAALNKLPHWHCCRNPYSSVWGHTHTYKYWGGMNDNE